MTSGILFAVLCLVGILDVIRGCTVACESIRFVSDARVYYRRPGQTSLSHIGRSNKKLEAQFASMLLNIDYVRRMDDGPRGRRACVTYLQNWLTCFYPDKPDIVQRAQDLARELGGQLATPSLSWKYAWIQKIAGWDNAKKAQGLWAKVKSSLIRNGSGGEPQWRRWPSVRSPELSE